MPNMLKRLYAHNYRCLDNFEMRFETMNLLLGDNGCGKSSIFDLLFNLRRILIDQSRIGDIFKQEDLTSWLNNSEQAFELEVQSPVGIYTYRLQIEHNTSINKQRINQERLTLDGKPLFEFIKGDVQLYHDDHTTGPIFPLSWESSALATVPVERNDNKKLTWFMKWIERIFIVNLQPKSMETVSQTESIWLGRDCSNFASWYRYFSQEHQDKIITLTHQLRDVIPGYHSFKLEQSGNAKILKVGFVSEEKSSPVFFDFGQLSDGQRVLLVLYTLVFGLPGLGLTLFLDEPENYVALPEIQPWLMELSDACGEGFPQVALISHHPELIDYFGGEYGQWLERDPLGPTRVRTSPERIYTGLKLSEQIARGWTE